MPKPDSLPADTAGPPCGPLRRLAIMIYDGLAVVGLLMVATFFSLPVTRGDVVALENPLFTAYLLLVWYAYLAVFWRRGGTPGMRAWRVRLVDDRGSAPIGWGRAALRFVLSLLSAAAFGLGYAVMLLDPRRRCFHDLAVGTAFERWPQTDRRNAQSPPASSNKGASVTPSNGGNR